MKKKIPKNDFVSDEILKEIITYRPLRLFIIKQKKKGNENNPFAIRREFLQISTEKQVKYYQKAIDKYIRLLDDKNIQEQAQIDGKLFDILLTKKEQRTYYESINAPTKPLNTAAAYYAEEKKQENAVNPKPWKSLTTDERKPYIKRLNNAKIEYLIQVKNFANDLSERLKAEYLAFVNQTHTSSSINDDHDENINLASISQRRKSVQSVAENDNHPKLTKTQLDDLHKCKPNVLYYEKKFSNNDKPTFANTLAKNNYIRSLFNQLSEKKRHKFILKSTKKWEEYLQLNPNIIENQIPTLHLLLGKQDDIYYYFSSLGLPVRPPISALTLYNNEKQQINSQQNWADLNQTIKDDYIKRLTKLKNEYHEKFIEFVEKILSSDYLRFEFFRNVKNAAKEYENFTKDRHVIVPIHSDEGQLKITQYLKPKIEERNNINEFDRIKKQLLATQLNNEQKKLVERLGELMNKYIEETTESKKNASDRKNSTGAINRNSSQEASNNVIIVNGENVEENLKKKNKKNKKRDRNEIEETNIQTSLSSTIKKRK